MTRQLYKKQLSIFELQAVIDRHRGETVYLDNAAGERIVASWLLELRLSQAAQVAEEILGVPVDFEEFRACWFRTPKPRARRTPASPQPPNTATFGGYRGKHARAVGVARRKKGKSK